MALEQTPLTPAQMTPAVSRAVGPTAGTQARMMAAQGLVPLGPDELVTAMYQLTFDQDPKVANVAKERSVALPDAVLGPALDGPLDPRVIDFFALQVVRKGKLVERVLLNRNTSDATFLKLAGKLKERELEILAGNQERMLRTPAIIEALYFNRNARMSTVQRLIELAARSGLTLTKIPHFAELVKGLGMAPEPAPVPPPQPGVAPAADPGQAPAASMMTEPNLDEQAMDSAYSAAMTDWAEEEEDEGEDWEEDGFGDQGEEKEEQFDLLNMPINTKIRLATIGSTSMRNALVKDANKLVAMAAITSPGVTDSEAAKHASNRGLHEDVIRYIASKREWQKNYMVKVNLVNNPKTPLAYSMRMLVHLRNAELKKLAGSKNVPSPLAQAANRLAKQRKA